MDLYHFYLLRAVGKGAFGKVRVVQHKQTKVCALQLSCLSTASHKHTHHAACEHGRRMLISTPFTGPLCAQIYQQGQVRQDEGRLQHHSRTKTAGGDRVKLYLQPQSEFRWRKLTRCQFFNRILLKYILTNVLCLHLQLQVCVPRRRESVHGSRSDAGR